MPHQHHTRATSALNFGLLFLAIICPQTLSFSWHNDKSADISPTPGTIDESLSDLLPTQRRLPDIYTIALNELQELESEPLCHRVAARLLVNNCQLVDGKDEATVLTDSGRQVRDFVDSYAASLAICDLERGSFAIPPQCDQFREATLSQLALRKESQLHVTTAEIDRCLTALGTSSSAWNTWISYRHKALHFCEAARADTEKAQSLLLYQQLTQVISRLVDGVELELQKHFDNISRRARESMESLEKITPQVDSLKEGLARVEKYLAGDLQNALKRSTESVQSNLHDMEGLRQVLGVLLQTVLESNSRVAFAHENALQQVTMKTNAEVTEFMGIITTAAASSIALQEQIETSRVQALDLAYRQDRLERGMDRLFNMTQKLSTKYDTHVYALDLANNMTSEILGALEETAATAEAVHESFFRPSVTGTWWPFIICPTASLVMGSYGLPPSAFRNLALVGLGEFVGFAITYMSRLEPDFLSTRFEFLSTNASTDASSFGL